MLMQYCVPDLPIAKSNTEGLICIIPQVDDQSMELGYLYWTSSVMEEAGIYPHWNKHILEMDGVCYASAHISLMDLQTVKQWNSSTAAHLTKVLYFQQCFLPSLVVRIHGSHTQGIKRKSGSSHCFILTIHSQNFRFSSHALGPLLIHSLNTSTRKLDNGFTKLETFQLVGTGVFPLAYLTDPNYYQGETG